MEDQKKLQDAFAAKMEWILEHEREADLNSSRFRQMIQEHGAVEAAHRLLDPGRQLPANTFGYLRKLNRLNLTMEYYVVQEQFHHLFTEQERQIAQWRLDNED